MVRERGELEIRSWPLEQRLDAETPVTTILPAARVSSDLNVFLGIRRWVGSSISVSH